VDIDPQANATVGIGGRKDAEPNVYDVLMGASAAADAILPTGIDGLSLLPASPDLAGREHGAPARGGLGDAAARGAGRYPRALRLRDPGLPAVARAADRQRARGGRPGHRPVQTEYFALEGLAGLLDTLALVQRELNPRLTVAGMLLTMHDARTRLARAAEEDVRKHFPALVFDTVIPRNVRIAESPSFGRPVIASRPALGGRGRVLRARAGGGRSWVIDRPVGAP
jgi:chromosome partitioning protein